MTEIIKQPPTYTEADITVLTGIEALRLRPAMYIGDTSTRGLHHLAEEVFANVVDEVMAGRCSQMNITLDKDGETLSILDNGNGIPVGINKSLNISTLELVMTKMHGGGKFKEGGYQKSAGLHGVGLKCVNALSNHTKVEVWTEGKYWTQEYSRGIPTTEVVCQGDTRKRGTKITFHADEQIFTQGITFNEDTLLKRLREIGYLTPALTIIFESLKTGRKETIHHPEGIVEYVKHLTRAREKQYPSVPFYSKSENDKFEVEVAFQYAEDDVETFLSFANSVNTMEGGTHVAGFRTAFTRVVNSFARIQGMLKEKDSNLTGEDIQEGITAIISVRLPQPQFEGQTKSKLGTSEANGWVNSMFGDALTEFLEKNPTVGRLIVDRAIISVKRREAAKKASADIKKQNPLDKMACLPGKLADCRSKNVAVNELYICEGDSAGGSAKGGRDRENQAVLPLRGKIINAERNDLASLIKNEEINALKTAIGTGILQHGIEDSFNIQKLRYGKIVILTDADDDGSHITALLMAFLYRYMQPLMVAGHVYLAVPPLFRISIGNGKKVEKKYYWTEAEKDAAMAKISDKKNVHVTRYKGLGEMNGDELGHTTMHPDTRVLIQVTVPRPDEANDILSVLMGNNVSVRKEHMIEYFSQKSHGGGNLFN